MPMKEQRDWPEVVTLGETMALLRADSVGPLQHVSTMSVGIGGAESNFAIALRRLGTSVAWAGRVGADSLGVRIRRELAAEGIEVIATADDDAPTGLMLKERRTAETQKVWYYRKDSAGSRMGPDDVPVQHIAHARLLHITGITPGLSQSAAEAVLLAVDSARRNGTLVSLDLNYRSALWSSEIAGPVFRDLISRAHLVFASDHEASIAVEDSDDPFVLAARLRELGPQHVVIKLGAEGSVALIDGERHVQQPVVVRAIDSVGAGDGFVAGYISEFLAGKGPAECLALAGLVGAFACLVPGDWEGMPLRSELGLLAATEPVSR
jgi:2-dehydro-3-deoxygluconokinase